MDMEDGHSKSSTARTSLDTENSDATMSTSTSDSSSVTPKKGFGGMKGSQLTPFASTLHKRIQKEEQVKAVPKRASVFTVPGGSRTQFDDSNVTNLLGISGHGSSTTYERNLQREHAVLERKHNDQASQTPVLNQQDRTKEVVTRIHEIAAVDDGSEVEFKMTLSPPLFSPDLSKDRESLQKAFEKLYQKRTPSEWTNKIVTDQIIKSYELTLTCMLYPTDARLSKREYLSDLSQKNFKALRRVFNISDEIHRQLMAKAVPVSQYVICLLEHRLEQLATSVIYSKGSFTQDQMYTVWLAEQKKEIEDWIRRLKTEPEFSGTVTVKVLDARDLAPKKNDETTSDPFVTVHISKHMKDKRISFSSLSSFGKKYDKQIQRTQTVKESLDPVWMEDIFFSVGPDYDKYNLKVVLYDEDSILNHYMGEVLIPLSDLSDQVTLEKWFPLTKGKSYERETIAGEIHLQVHLTIRKRAPDTPPAFSVKWPNEVEVHQGYRELVFKLVQLENSDLRSNEVQPLSLMSQAVLDEYALRYGIGPHYRFLSLLEILVEFFRYQLRKSFVSYVMQIVLEIEANKTNNVTMTKKEELMWNELTAELKKHIENVFKMYKHFFKGRKFDGTLCLLIKVYSIIKMGLGENPDAALVNFVKIANECYYDMLMVQMTEDEEENADKEATEELKDPRLKFMKICDELMLSIEEDIQLYQGDFPSTVNTVLLAATTLRDRLTEAMKPVLSDERHITALTFDLYFKVMEFNSFLAEKAPGVNPIDLSPYFTPLVHQWIDQTEGKLKEWAKRMIATETWEPLDPSEELSLLHSFSIVDLFRSINEALNFMFSIKTNLRSTVEYFIKRVVKTVVSIYIEAVKSSSIQCLASTDSTVGCKELMEVAKKQRLKHTIQLSLTKDLCVRFNNIDMAQTLLMDLTAYVEKKLELENELESLFDDTFDHVRQAQVEIKEILAHKMNRDISVALQLLADKKSVQEVDPDMESIQRLEPLFCYLNIQLQVLSENLYVGIFQKILRNAFILVIKDLERIVVPYEFKDKNDRREIAKIVENNLADIESFFHADGEGISINFIQKHTQLLRDVFGIFNKPTEEVIAMYENLSRASIIPAEDTTLRIKLEPDPTVLSAHHMISILACRKKSDKAAKKLLAKVKGNARDLELRRHFNLAPTEVLVDRFNCPNEGSIYITTSFLCYEPMRGIDRRQLSIAKIASARKTGNTTLEFVMNDLEEHKFSGILDRTNLLEVLKERARSLNNPKLLESIQSSSSSSTTVSHASSRESISDDASSKGSVDPPSVNSTPIKKGFHRRNLSTASSTSDNMSTDSDESVRSIEKEKDKEQKKLDKFRKKYHQASDATLLQEYKCHCKYLGVGKPGKMKVTDKYLCFNSPLAPKLILAFDRIKEMKREEDKLKVLVEFEDKSVKKFVFGHFKDFEQAYKFLMDLWKTAK